MCVIIHKPEGVIIPEQKIESAWQNNKDGFGVTFNDRGQFHIRKWLSKDPDEINKFLAEIKDCDAMLHLRFKTRGKVDRSNLHPFSVLTKKNHGVDLQFCHNGTLYDFGNDDQSDSAEFAQTILKPMFEMLAKKYDGDISAILDDEFGQQVVDKFRGSSSVFTLYGSDSQWIKFGKGVDFEEGWWASNNSYFSNYARSKPVTTTTTAPGKSVVPFETTAATNTGQPTKPQQTGTANKWKKLPDRVDADDIFALVDIDDISDLCYYSQKDFEDMIMDYPYEASCLIRHLVQEMYWEQYMDKKQEEGVDRYDPAI